MIIEIPVYHHPDGSRTIGQPDPRHGVRLGGIAMAVLNLKNWAQDPNIAESQRKSARNPQKSRLSEVDLVRKEISGIAPLAPLLSTSRTPQKSAVFTRPVALASTTPCDCLSCQTGRPDYPCLLEGDDA
ncbi:hypothetical protein ACFOKF_16390 [Sphingobium rhizovicinum]|uniref:Transposase n=1 Tax=Sphingobium rhizovicinum TaxID=432308 RepID=A0ABV7NHH1_9SPHN